MNRKGNPTVSSTLCQPPKRRASQEKNQDSGLQLCHLLTWPHFLAGSFPLPSQSGSECPVSSSENRRESPDAEEVTRRPDSVHTLERQGGPAGAALPFRNRAVTQGSFYK